MRIKLLERLSFYAGNEEFLLVSARVARAVLVKIPDATAELCRREYLISDFKNYYLGRFKMIVEKASPIISYDLYSY